MLCKFGLHRWQKRATHRPGTAVYRCISCDKRITLHRNRRRLEKRYLVLGAICFSLAAWFVIINLGMTGHTKVIHDTEKLVAKVERASSEARGELHKLEGDEGYTRARTPTDN